MERLVKKRVLVLSNLLAIVIVALFILLISYFSLDFNVKISGRVVGIEKESIVPWGDTEGKSIVILSPKKDKIYNFDKNHDFVIDLNVSANFDVKSWRFTLLDSEHSGKIIKEKGPFEPNITINPARWSNELIVYAYDNKGEEVSERVSFYVSTLNSAPVIENTDPEVYACEGSALEYHFNVTDIDENKNPGAIESSINPTNYPHETFYMEPLSYWPSNGSNSSLFKIISGKINKEKIGEVNNGFKTYEKEILVTDSVYADARKINITLIEINNPPAMQKIGVQTILTKGDNSDFYKQAIVNDAEDGNQNSGNFEFKIKILDSMGQEINLFDIDSIGIMSFKANESHKGLYNVSICVSDRGIEYPHERIYDLCNQTGDGTTECKDFSLNILKENRGPTITDYSPASSSLNISKIKELEFNISLYDPDRSPLDIYWYVGNVLKKYSGGVWSGDDFDEFRYDFDCGITEDVTVKAEVTDGLVNDSIFWKLNNNLSCQEGARVGDCIEKWLCSPWEACQNLDSSLKVGVLPYEDYFVMKEECLGRGWNEEGCGFQIRNCFDVNECNLSYDMPPKIQNCFYTKKSGCDDKIKNCHQGGCELLVDCGGPCPACPTCSDGIKNQGEEDVDCGGPCMQSCVYKEVKTKKPRRWAYSFLIIILLIVVIAQISKLIKIGKEFKQEEFQQ